MNEDHILSLLQEAVQAIRTEEDPLELNVYRRLFRKGVPFTLRSYFAAWALKQLSDGSFSGRNSSGRKERSSRNSRKERPAKAERPERAARNVTQPAASEERKARQSESRPVALSEDVSTTLFVSIGRNRRVYPRDLISLIMQHVEMDRDHIGEIRVLDNYSFVQVITEDAGKIIEELNDIEYRGRKLVVSFSRKKEDQDDTGVQEENSAETEAGFDYQEEESGDIE